MKNLRHVVMFKFKDSATADDVQKIVDAFGLLPAKMPTITAFEWGTNNSPENLNQQFTHCFMLTFATEQDRDNYLIAAEHKAFVAVLRPHLEKAFVLDYWAQ